MNIPMNKKARKTENMLPASHSCQSKTKTKLMTPKQQKSKTKHKIMRILGTYTG